MKTNNGHACLCNGKNRRIDHFRRSHRYSSLLILSITILFLLSSNAFGAGVIMPVSTNSEGIPQGGVDGAMPSHGSVSADGMEIAFISRSSNLVSNDLNGKYDVFWKNLLTGQIMRVSTSSDGVEANDASSKAAVSGDGRFVAYGSNATNLSPLDANGWLEDIFLKDTITDMTYLLSTDSSGNQPTGSVQRGNSRNPSISDDGRYVAFESTARLVPNDYGSYDIFVKNTLTNETIKASNNQSGVGGNGSSYWPSLSGDGRFVTFHSTANNLVADDTNGKDDVFIKDLSTGQVSRISTDSYGMQANNGSSYASISMDGRYVSFYSSANNLVSNDTNNIGDVFVKDRVTGETKRVSTDTDGSQATRWNGGTSSISGDGRFVLFTSSDGFAGDQDPAGNIYQDVFVKDFSSGATILLSTTGSGSGGALSLNGKYAVLQVSDNSGANAIIADTTNCTGGKPAIRLDREVVFWESYSEYLSRTLTVKYGLSNGGDGIAMSTRLVSSNATGGAFSSSSFPISVEPLFPSAVRILKIRYSVPVGVGVFNTMNQGTSKDRCGTTYSYP